MAIRNGLKRGFTLVELMIVVAIVGVLAVLAVYGVRKYIANAKTAEAKNSLGQMGKDAVTAYEGESMAAGVLPEGSSTATLRRICGTGTNKSVPTDGKPPAAKKYQSTKADWSNTDDVAKNVGFPCIRFEMTAPQYYAYGYEGSGAETGSFTAYANGDLNGDTKNFSTFSLMGTVQNGRLNIAPSIGENSPEE